MALGSSPSSSREEWLTDKPQKSTLLLKVTRMKIVPIYAKSNMKLC